MRDQMVMARVYSILAKRKKKLDLYQELLAKLKDSQDAFGEAIFDEDLHHRWGYSFRNASLDPLIIIIISSGGKSLIMFFIHFIFQFSWENQSYGWSSVKSKRRALRLQVSYSWVESNDSVGRWTGEKVEEGELFPKSNGSEGNSHWDQLLIYAIGHSLLPPSSWEEDVLKEREFGKSKSLPLCSLLRQCLSCSSCCQLNHHACQGKISNTDIYLKYICACVYILFVWVCKTVSRQLHPHVGPHMINPESWPFTLSYPCELVGDHSCDARWKVNFIADVLAREGMGRQSLCKMKLGLLPCNLCAVCLAVYVLWFLQPLGLSFLYSISLLYCTVFLFV